MIDFSQDQLELSTLIFNQIIRDINHDPNNQYLMANTASSFLGEINVTRHGSFHKV